VASARVVDLAQLGGGHQRDLLAAARAHRHAGPVVDLRHGGHEPHHAFLERGAHAHLHRLLALGADVHVVQLAAEEAEHVQAHFVAVELLGEAHRAHHHQRLGVDDAQVHAHRLAEGARLHAHLVHRELGAAGVDVVVQLGDAADDEVVRLVDGAAEVRQPRHVLPAVGSAHLVVAAVPQLSAVGVGELALGDHRVEALGDAHRAAELAQRRIHHQRATLRDGVAFVDAVLAGVVLHVAHADDDGRAARGGDVVGVAGEHRPPWA
jgi:hypothetical protein